MSDPNAYAHEIRARLRTTAEFEPATELLVRVSRRAHFGTIAALKSEMVSEKISPFVFEGRCEATWKREFKLPGREAGPPNHLDDKVDWDQ